MDTHFVQKKQDVDYEYCLRAFLGRYSRCFSDGICYQDSPRPSVQFCSIAFQLSTFGLPRRLLYGKTILVLFI